MKINPQTVVCVSNLRLNVVKAKLFTMLIIPILLQRFLQLVMQSMPSRLTSQTQITSNCC